MKLNITPKVLAKIGQQDHGSLSQRDVEQCFENWNGGTCTDAREEHRTDPPTQWFVSEDNRCRKIKVVFVQVGDDIYIKSAYPATDDVVRIYRKFCTH